MHSLLRGTARALALVLSLTWVWLPAAQAGTITMAQVLGHELAQRHVEQAQAALQRAEVREQLAQLGVDAEAAAERLAALTPEEIAALDQRLQDLPAGSGALEIIGAVFLVLLILELVGVINIFKSF